MKISVKGLYSLRVLLDVAERRQTFSGQGGPAGGVLVSAADISARLGVSKKHLEQIIATLNKPGFLVSGRGASGGNARAAIKDCAAQSVRAGLSGVVTDYLDSVTLQACLDKNSLRDEYCI